MGILICAAKIDKDLKEFQQGNQFDDITMLALKRES
jgi:serine phosphatase RsbU (regulator of sigma subunit)